MQLKSIKLAGFKTFVDPNVMTIPARIVGLVGPNGCGKSNIIDAVRWVMGESAAGHLRGTSMDDVIFNGSSKRKPVNQASVELLFDNSEGRIGGAWAEYREISIKRVVDRGAGSSYYLNGTKCRRRDVMDVFLGTGLGPRSYSIIEQGMISRVIEAKPAELRVFIEEAAGVSRYKERRRETENRIRHTEDNLNRLSDLMQEVKKQADRAERQAKTAKRYKAIEQDLLISRQSLYALMHADLETQLVALKSQLAEQESQLIEENRALRKQENDHLAQKTSDMAEQQALEDSQQRFYECKAEVGKLEQKIEFIQTAQRQADQQSDQRGREIERLGAQSVELQAGLSEQQIALATLDEQIVAQEAQLEELSAQREAAKETLREAEVVQQAQQQQQAELDRDNSLLTLQIQQHERDRERSEVEIQKLQDESAALSQLLDAEQTEVEGDDLMALEAIVADVESQLEVAEIKLAEKRDLVDDLRRQSLEATSELNTQQGKLEALQNIQQQALEAEDGKKAYQLPEHYQQAPRLTEMLSVNEGWEQAVEATLSDWLTARVLSKFPENQDADYLLNSDIGVVVDRRLQDERFNTEGRLSEQLRQAPQSVVAVAQHIHTAEDLPSAMACVDGLAAHESVVTKAGEWLFPMGIRPGNQTASLEQSLIYRQRIIAELEQSTAQLYQETQAQSTRLGTEQAELVEQEQQITDLKKQSTEQQLALSKRQAEHSARLRQTEERQTRLAAIDDSMTTLVAHQEGVQQQVLALAEKSVMLSEQLAEITAEQPAIQQQKVAADVAFEEIDRQYHQCNREQQQQQIEQTKLNGQINSAETRVKDLSDRITQLREQQNQALESDQKEELETLESDLQSRLTEQQQAEQQLDEKRAESAERQKVLDEMMGLISEIRERIQQQSDQKNKLLIEQAEKQQQADYQISRLSELGVTIRQAQAVVAQRREAMADSGQQDNFSTDTLTAEVERLTQQLEQMGNINAGAIDEFAELSDRLTYLNEQHEDLSTALDTLRDAIASIDEETKSRFENTFNAVNEQVQILFPKLFGGGKARLELTDDDMLNAGVRIIARPPGKMPASIQLLSGGEKALTAAALVFGIFQLNPSPFCMLDEVDAPLDDANVGRFCALVKSLSDRVQFIIVTHNKVTMEIAEQLSGVTMGEPGVSRLVQVDIDDAVAMVGA